MKFCDTADWKSALRLYEARGHLVASVCVGDRVVHAGFDCGGRNGHQQRGRDGSAGLAQFVRVQYVFVSAFKVGGRNSTRTSAPADCVDAWCAGGGVEIG